ncbi:hypothetical protein CR513_23205, partial [Mucuna pruriens]
MTPPSHQASNPMSIVIIHPHQSKDHQSKDRLQFLEERLKANEGVGKRVEIGVRSGKIAHMATTSTKKAPTATNKKKEAKQTHLCGHQLSPTIILSLSHQTIDLNSCITHK